MLVSMNWIKDFVDLSGIDILELIHRFTLSTAEVENILIKGEDIHDVVVGEIKEIKNHPNSNKLHLLKIDCGDSVFSCVCGAPNVSLGQKVAFVKAGGSVVNGKIEKCIVAGFESEGMCCSESELGISDDNSGLMAIEKEIPNGTDIKSVYPIDDIIFEVDNKSLTNRPDLWGHYGIAREFAALTSQKLRKLKVSEAEYEGEECVNVTVNNKDLVYRYSSVKIDNITKSVSPGEVRIRLFYCGIRAINLVADLTNYIMLEIGQPMHAFDSRSIKNIVVDTPKQEFDFMTLDNINRKIDTSMLMIYNQNTPVAIAGVMGGLDSEIKCDTTSVVLESANFDGINVRKTSSKLGLRTDASIRYEKILDPELTIIAIKRFIELLKEVDPEVKVASKLIDVYVKKYPEICISFDKKYVDKYTGIDISVEEIRKTLQLLGFEVIYENDCFYVKVPSWRATKDVTIKADIIEEITRIYGYDNFAISTTLSKLKPVRITNEKYVSETMKDILVNKFNMNEVHSYIWCDGKKFKKIGIDVEENVRIMNIATPENGTIRNSMLPTLLCFVYENRSFSNEFSIFEIGRAVEGTMSGGLCNEKKKLGIVLFSKERTEKDLYFEAADIVKVLIDNVMHKTVRFEKSEVFHEWQHPKNTSRISVEQRYIGFINTLHPNNLAKIDKNCAVASVEIDMDELCAIQNDKLHYEEPSKFPGIDYDLSLNIDAGIRYEHIENSWSKLELSDLVMVKVIDTYESTNVKSITLRFSFASMERTLSLEEVQSSIDRIVENLSKIGITLRA